VLIRYTNNDSLNPGTGASQGASTGGLRGGRVGRMPLSATSDQ
jgi:hypothetical protein